MLQDIFTSLSQTHFLSHIMLQEAFTSLSHPHFWSHIMLQYVFTSLSQTHFLEPYYVTICIHFVITNTFLEAFTSLS